MMQPLAHQAPPVHYKNHGFATTSGTCIADLDGNTIATPSTMKQFLRYWGCQGLMQRVEFVDLRSVAPVHI